MHRRAKQQARLRLDTFEFEYRRIYNLTANDPRFLEATREEMVTDVWAHRYKEDPKLLDEIEDEDFDPDSVARELGYEQQGGNADDWEEL